MFASDPVPTAVERARVATAGRAEVWVDCEALPAAVPHEPIDLAVVSEVLYSLDADPLTPPPSTRPWTAPSPSWNPGGDLLVVHWRGWPAEAPRDAAATHAMLCDRSVL